MPQSSAMSLMVILLSGFCSSRCFSEASSARFVTCDMARPPFPQLRLLYPSGGENARDAPRDFFAGAFQTVRAVLYCP